MKKYKRKRKKERRRKDGEQSRERKAWMRVCERIRYSEERVRACFCAWLSFAWVRASTVVCILSGSSCSSRWRRKKEKRKAKGMREREKERERGQWLKKNINTRPTLVADEKNQTRSRIRPRKSVFLSLPPVKIVYRCVPDRIFRGNRLASKRRIP